MRAKLVGSSRQVLACGQRPQLARAGRLRSGIARALVTAGVIHALSNFAFVAQAWVGHDISVLALTIFVENFTGGLVSAAFVAYLSGLCHPAFTATQYALFSSMYALPGKLLMGTSGFVVDALGYPQVFAYTSALGLPALVLLFLVVRSTRKQDTQAKI